MKKIDSRVMADLIAAVIGQCKADIVKYLLKGGKIDDARDAIRFIMSKDFELYLYMLGMPKQDFDVYRQAILKDCSRLAGAKKGVRRNVA